MNINLWFARNNHGEIITILNSNITNTYTCPICNSEVIPKALESKQVTPHFAHIDRSKCTGESFIHFWMKHGFIERGDTFTIISDESHIFTCKDFKTEVTFNLKTGVYRPDIVIETECGNEIVFEMAHKNKKKVQDYIDRWIELDKIVVEVDTPTLTGQNEVKEFKALYYKGKCFNFNKRDGGYYKTIGKLKEKMKQSGKYDIELVKKLDWFWDEVCKYENNEDIDLNEMYLFLETMNPEEFKIIDIALKKRKSNEIIKGFMDTMYKKLFKQEKEKVKFIEEKFLNVNYLNKMLKSNKIEYIVESIEFSINKFYIMYKNNDGSNYKIEFKLYRYDGVDIEERLNKIHNRMAYKEIESVLKHSIDELNNDYKEVSFKLDFDRKGFAITVKHLFNRLDELFYFDYYNYDEIYMYKNDFIDKSKFKNNLLDKSFKGSRERECKTCSKLFNVSSKEYFFYIGNRLEIPKRCKSCRNKRKKEKLNG
ncbi:competence protein CoiA family protein [Lysinibacillus sp. FSL K6-0102]|uniref:competence protein CoiA family protein n=1 Tax=Lysinibacillus sp. FSL K6-0102 TaxID=2975290 RepID=UPI0030FC9E35